MSTRGHYGIEQEIIEENKKNNPFLREKQEEEKAKKLTLDDWAVIMWAFVFPVLISALVAIKVLS